MGGKGRGGKRKLNKATEELGGTSNIDEQESEKQRHDEVTIVSSETMENPNEVEALIHKIDLLLVETCEAATKDDTMENPTKLKALIHTIDLFAAETCEGATKVEALIDKIDLLAAENPTELEALIHKIELLAAETCEAATKVEALIEKVHKLEFESARRFSSTDILNFTSHFAIKIGSGAVGDVYKGQFPDGVKVAVVNMLITCDVDEMTFMDEINTISRTYHRNLIKIYGFCFEGDVKALVYQYMENGSLDSILYKKDNGIDFAKFYQIALEIAKGIAHLHDGCNEKIIHHDLNPANVLLDENLSPKVANFGMSKILKTNKSNIFSRHYTAPEMHSRTTIKCDVYSFGMILFEITNGEGNSWFPEIIWDEFENRNNRKARVLSLVALWCVQFTPETRPSMTTVVRILENQILVNMPPNPFLPTDPLESIMQPLQVLQEISSPRADVPEKVKSMKHQQSIQMSNASVYPVAMLMRELVFEKAKRYSSDELATFTSNFDNEIGFGAFGNVFKGQFYDGTEVAVKLLKTNEFVQHSFLTEIRTIGKTDHRNLIKLFGFCLEENMLALVYEYMENGSLDMILYKKPLTIEWSKLYAIAVEIATALAYLHHGCEDQIIHHDIKASNVLLDSNHLPKLADFGLANLKDREKTHLTMSGMKGTPGYAAPEIWTPFSPITYKGDVYGFGKILFEILGMERNTHTDIWFPNHVWEQFNSGKLDDVVMECGISEKNMKKTSILSMVALWCAQFTPQTRPSMCTVVTVLKNEILVKRPPNPFLQSGLSALMQPAQNS